MELGAAPAALSATAPARLLLVRHGPPAASPPRGLLDRAAVERWRAACDEAALVRDAVPPATLLRAAAGCGCVLASDLPRALSTAVALAARREVVGTPLLREHDLPLPRWRGRAPLLAWEAVVHARWLADILRGRDAPPPVAERAAEAARWVDAHAAAGGAVVVTHGVFRRLLAHHLEAMSWTRAGGRRGWGHWSAWTLVRA